MTWEETTVITTSVAPTRPKHDKSRQCKSLPQYHVVLWNDDDHTFVYVMKMLRSIFGHSLEAGLRLAQEVDAHGRAVVATTHRELAELRRDQIHAYGKDPEIKDCAGSMSATIEAV